MGKFKKLNMRIKKAKPVRVEWYRKPHTKIKESKKLYKRDKKMKDETTQK